MAQSAETDHTNFLARGDTPAAQGRVGCDAGAEERRGSGEIEIGWNPQNEVLVDHDAVGISTIGNAPEVLVRGVEGEDLVRAKLLKSILALGAGPVRVDQTADRGEVPGLERGDCGADLGDTADDLVARHDRVDGRHEGAPLVTDLVEIGVADPAEQDFDLYVAFVWIATLDLGGGKRRCCTRSGVSFGVVRRFILLLVCLSGVVLFVANLFRALDGIERTPFHAVLLARPITWKNPFSRIALLQP